MKKKLSIFMLLVLLINNIFFPIKTVMAESKKMSFIISDQVQEDSQVVDIQFLNQDKFDTLIIDYSSNVMLEEDSVEFNSDVNYQHNQSKSELIMTEMSNLSQISFVLTGITQYENSIKIKGYKDGQLIEQMNYQFFHPQSDERSSLGDEVELSSQDIDLFSHTLQSDVKIEPVQSTISSGDSALYKLVLKVTGSQVSYNNVNLSVKLPVNQETVNFTQNLDALKIEGITPTFNKDTNVLEYYFDTLLSGRTYEKVIRLETKNGLMENETELIVQAQLDFLDDPEIEKKEESATVVVNASGSMAIEKSIVEIKDGIAKPGGLIKWKLKVAIPTRDKGQLYLEPGTFITIEDSLPKSLIYRPDIKGQYDAASIDKQNNMMWKIPVPSLEEQMKATDYLFTEEIEFWTEVKNDKNLVNQTIQNTADVGGTFVGSEYRKSYAEAKSSVVIRKSTGETATIEGNVVYPSHTGPADTVGKIASNSFKNPKPTGDDSAYLGFSHSYWSYHYGVEDSIKDLELVYSIDPNLVFDKIQIMGDSWQFARSNAESDKNIPLTMTPTFKLVITYRDKDGKFRELPPIDNLEYGETYTRDELGIDPDLDVSEIRHVFNEDMPQGAKNSSRTRYYFTVKPGYVGEVKNSYNIIGKSTYNVNTKKYGKKYIDFDLKKDFPKLFDPKENDVLGERTAIIQKNKNNSAPTTEIGVELVNNKGSVVEPGQNRLKVTFSNLASSTNSIQEPLESVVLLPPGVKVDASPNPIFLNNAGNKVTGQYEVVSDNYNDSGRQLVKIKWDEKYIRPEQQITAELDVTIADNAPSSLYFDVYGFSGNQDLKVPTVSNPTLLNTVRQIDSDDLNGDGNTEQTRIKSGNVYTLLTQYDLQTEKFVKGPGEDWSKFAKTEPGSTVDYRLTMTNTTGREISNMTLIDVLPSVGDLGITDNISRNSQFTPHLKGPIQLPAEWEGKVKVYYSESKNPKRDDLIRETIYPTGTEKLGNPANAEEPNWTSADDVTNWQTIHSFKIELLPGVTWIKGVEMDITYTMTTPNYDDIENKDLFDIKKDPSERAAWNSFAVSTDKGQPVEPERVGVYMEQPTGHFKLTKVDSETKETLSGAYFELRHKTDGTIHPLVTDSNGVAEVKDIPVGIYELVETKAPNGYRLLQQPIEVEITGVKNTISLTVENTKTGWELPNTGGDGILLSSMIGLMFMSVGLSLMRLRNEY